MTELTELLEQGERFVRDSLLTRREKEIHPFYHLVAPPAGADVMVPCFWATSLEKDIMVAIVKETSRKIKAVAALFVCEAWMVKQDRKKGEPLDYCDMPPPSEHPDRVEVVQIIATDGSDVLASMLEIKRDWKNRIIDLIKGDKPGKADMFSGRMIDGIIPPRSIH